MNGNPALMGLLSVVDKRSRPEWRPESRASGPSALLAEQRRALLGILWSA